MTGKARGKGKRRQSGRGAREKRRRAHGYYQQQEHQQQQQQQRLPKQPSHPPPWFDPRAAPALLDTSYGVPVTVTNNVKLQP